LKQQRETRDGRRWTGRMQVSLVSMYLTVYSAGQKEAASAIGAGGSGLDQGFL
jgi:hypothetical protein